MALDLSKLNFFGRLSARSRVAVLLGAVIGVVLIIYFGTRYFSGGSRTTGPSRVANAPSNLQSVPGGELTPEYYRALMQSSSQAAQQAQISGGSAMPTLVNVPGQAGGASCIVCSDQQANVKTLLDDWVKQGKISPEVASMLQDLADKNVPVEEYAAMLDRLVKEGKLTPEQARMLLEQYKKQRANALLAESAKTMDDMIKAGQLPLDVANQLLEAQKKGMSPAEYAAELQRLVREGKISPEVAQRLLAQYAQQFAKQVIMKSIAILEQWSRAGEITPDVLKELVRLENEMVPTDQMAATLQDFVSKGKLTPAVSDKILAEYKEQKSEIGATGTIDELIRRAEGAAFQEISELLRDGKITPETGAQLTDMIQKNVSLDQFKAAVNQMVQQGKLTPDLAKLKIGDYELVKKYRDEKDRLLQLQANNVSPEQYAEELKRAVAAGILTPEEAAQLMQEYLAATAKIPTAPPVSGPGSEQFAALQQRVQQGAPQGTTFTPGAGEFAAVQTQVTTETAQDREARIQAIMSAMSGQAQQLINSWQPPSMQNKTGSAEVAIQKPGTSSTTTTTTTSGKEGGVDSATGTGAPVIKAGSILFAVLDTAVNSDYPDSPVLATIVAGPLKGSKMLGKLVTAKGVSGQMDRVSLNFILMNNDSWLKSKTVTAYAIDPDTARTVLASNVDYHYMMRFGAMMATSFLQGYGQAVMGSGGSSVQSAFGTSTQNPQLSPGNKLAVALGQMGQTLGNATQNYINRPPTVRVDSGVGLGILFMSDVS